MKKYFLIAALMIVCCLHSSSQTGEGFRVDSLRIDKITKTLPLLTGTNRVDSMLLLCVYYDYAYPRIGRFTFWEDTVKHYAKQAYTEAKNLGYKRGIALALLNLKTNSEKEKNIHEAIQIGQQINDDDVLGLGYYNLAVLTSTSFEDYVEDNKKAIGHYHKSGDILREAEANFWLFNAYLNRGKLETALDYGKRGIDLLVSQKKERNFVNGNYLLMQNFLSRMAELYTTAGDYETAIKYLRVNESYGKAHETYYDDFSPNIAEVYCKMDWADSAFYYADTTKYREEWIKMNDVEKTWGRSVLGQALLLKKEYNRALALFLSSIDFFTKMNNSFAPTETILFAGQAYEGQKNFTKALQYAKEGVGSAEKGNARPTIMQSYQLLSSIYHQLGNNDSAYIYLLKFNTLKDSIQNKQLLLRLYDYQKAAEDEKKQAQLLLLDKDNKLKTVQLKQQAQQKDFLTLGLVSLFLIGFFIFRWLSLKQKNEKLNNEKIQTELQQRTVELEMQALRAQMNPHFIFNCLSSINRFILKNEGKTASSYLVRFSRLIRMVLINSQKPLITLEDELQMLTIYLDMERLRFKDSFDYGITFLNTMETDKIFIPPLLLQPFCENAIWHGLMHKEGQGRLNIEFSMKDNILHCTITDNGIGLEKSEEMKSKSAEKEKSLGLKITTERLALLNREKGLHSFFEIENILDEDGNSAGTKINLKIGYKEAVEGLI